MGSISTLHPSRSTSQQQAQKAKVQANTRIRAGSRAAAPPDGGTAALAAGRGAARGSPPAAGPGAARAGPHTPLGSRQRTPAYSREISPSQLQHCRGTP